MTRSEKCILLDDPQNKFLRTRISFVYLIYIEGVVRYVGKSKSPKQRWCSHKSGVLKNYKNYRFEIFGVFPEEESKIVEKELIKQMKNNELLNKTSFNPIKSKPNYYQPKEKSRPNLVKIEARVSKKAFDNCKSIAKKKKMTFSQIVNKAIKEYRGE